MTFLEIRDNVFVDKLYNFVPEFSALADVHGKNSILWIVLMYDYWSPYRNVEEKERATLIEHDIKVKPFTGKEKTAAINRYNQLQYDPLVHQYNVLTKKLKDITTVIDNLEVTKETVEQVQTIIKNNEKVNDTIFSLQDHLKIKDRTNITYNITAYKKANVS